MFCSYVLLATLRLYCNILPLSYILFTINNFCSQKQILPIIYTSPDNVLASVLYVLSFRFYGVQPPS